jgi:hypothetical protein
LCDHPSFQENVSDNSRDTKYREHHHRNPPERAAFGEQRNLIYQYDGPTKNHDQTANRDTKRRDIASTLGMSRIVSRHGFARGIHDLCKRDITNSTRWRLVYPLA